MPATRNPAAKSERTRRRIVDAAAAAYRERGLKGVGVREIMKRAGLTQGGFYFHFPDKDALFKEASRAAAIASIAAYVDIAERASPDKRLQAFIEAYLSAEHRDHPESGCIVSALGGEVGRADARQRAAFVSGVGMILERVAAYVPGKDAPERKQKAGLLMASMAGVLMVSRLHPDTDSSNAFLARSRRFFTASFGEA